MMKRNIAACVLWLVALAGCGQRGPLTLPGQPAAAVPGGAATATGAGVDISL